MTLRLEFQSGPWADHVLDVPGSVVLGRTPSHGVSVEDPAVSAEHCRVFLQDGHAWIEDLDSTNGTEVNGAAVKTAELKDGDRIAIGESLIRVELSGTAVGVPNAECGARNAEARTETEHSPCAGDAYPAVETHPDQPDPEVSGLDQRPGEDVSDGEAHHRLADEVSQGASVPAATYRSQHRPQHPPRHGTRIVERTSATVATTAAGSDSTAESKRRRSRAWVVLPILLMLLGACFFMFKGKGDVGPRGPNMLAPAARDAAIAAFEKLGVTLTVQEPRGVARKAEPVTSGVPLPQGCVKDVEKLRLLGPDGKPTPCQFTVLSRWPSFAQGATKGKPDGSIKWVLLDFQADVGGSNKTGYTLCMSKEDVAVSRPVGISRAGGTLNLETGNLKIGIETNRAGLIHAVSLNGRNLVEEAAPMQAVLVDGSNRVYRASKPDSVVVEVQGPMRSVARVSGHFVDDAGKGLFGGKVGYDLRITAYAGKPQLKLDFTLRNDGWYGYRNEGKRHPRQWLHLRSLRLDIPVGGSASTAEFAGRKFELAAGKTVDFTQWLMYPLGNARGQRDIVFTNMPPHVLAAKMEKRIPGGFHYTWTAEGRMEGEPGKAPGWIRQSGGEGPALGLAARRFWQNFPMGFSAQPDMLSYVMLPEGECWPRTRKAYDAGTYQFEGGRRKTATLLLTFGDEAGAGEAAVAALDSPLFARAPAEWYRDTGAVLPLSAGAPAFMAGMKDSLQVEAVERYDRLQRAKVNAEYADPVGEHRFFKMDRWGKVSIPSLQEKCPDVFCGFMNYGDLVWSFGYCSLYYQWPYSMLQHYLRLGDREFLDVGEDMVRHRYDIDQYHVENTEPWLGGFQRYEKGEHGHLERQGRGLENWEKNTHASHTWNRDLLLHWALTGDPRSLAAAEQTGRAFHRFLYGQHKLGEKEKLPWAEFRVPVWAMENWLALYEYTGEPKWLAWANEVFDKTLLAMERDNGSCGHIVKEGKQSAQFTGYMVEPVCRLHHVTGRKDAVEFLKRVLDWQRQEGIVRGEEKDGVYYPIMWREDWGYDPELSEEISIGVGNAYDYPLLDGYAYLYRVFGRGEDLEFSRRLFREALFYIMTDRVKDPAYRSPLGYHHLADVFGFTPKLRAWDGRYGQIYLCTEEEAAKP